MEGKRESFVFIGTMQLCLVKLKIYETKILTIYMTVILPFSVVAQHFQWPPVSRCPNFQDIAMQPTALTACVKRAVAVGR